MVKTVHGPETCPVAPKGCEACWGLHHWIECGADPSEPFDPENDPPCELLIRQHDAVNGTENLMAYWACKHCDAWAECGAEDDDDEEFEDDDSEFGYQGDPVYCLKCGDEIDSEPGDLCDDCFDEAEASYGEGE